MTYRLGVDGGGTACRFLADGEVGIHDERWLTYPWGVLGGEPGMRSTKRIARVDGSEQWLRSRGADSVVVVGLTTSGCMLATVLDALQYDFVAWVPREAVADRNADAHAANLHDMHAKYADVVALDDVIGALS